jgi:hypothetical protein
VRIAPHLSNTIDFSRLCSAQVAGSGLARAAICENFELDLLAFVERGQTSAFNSADVHKNVRAAVIGLNEAKTFCRVEPFYGTSVHLGVPFENLAVTVCP